MSSNPANAQVAVFGDHEKNTLAQLYDVASRAERAALMADGHLGYVMPIGGVAAYREQVSVAGVGFDIACGNAAIRTDLSLATPGFVDRLNDIADAIQDDVSFGVGRKNQSGDAPVDHPLFKTQGASDHSSAFCQLLNQGGREIFRCALSTLEPGFQSQASVAIVPCRRMLDCLQLAGDCRHLVWGKAAPTQMPGERRAQTERASLE